jgi:hypothetical protein
VSPAWHLAAVKVPQLYDGLQRAQGRSAIPRLHIYISVNKTKFNRIDYNVQNTFEHEKSDPKCEETLTVADGMGRGREACGIAVAKRPL